MDETTETRYHTYADFLACPVLVKEVEDVLLDAATALAPIAQLAKQDGRGLSRVPDAFLQQALEVIKSLESTLSIYNPYVGYYLQFLLDRHRSMLAGVILPAFAWLARVAAPGYQGEAASRSFQAYHSDVKLAAVITLLFTHRSFRPPSPAVLETWRSMVRAVLAMDMLQCYAASMALYLSQLREGANVGVPAAEALAAGIGLAHALRCSAWENLGPSLQCMLKRVLVDSAFLEHACGLRLALVEVHGQCGYPNMDELDYNLLVLLDSFAMGLPRDLRCYPPSLRVTHGGVVQHVLVPSAAQAVANARLWKVLSHPAVQYFLGWWAVAPMAVLGAGASRGGVGGGGDGSYGLPAALLAGCPARHMTKPSDAWRLNRAHDAAAECWRYALSTGQFKGSSSGGSRGNGIGSSCGSGAAAAAASIADSLLGAEVVGGAGSGGGAGGDGAAGAAATANTDAVPYTATQVFAMLRSAAVYSVRKHMSESELKYAVEIGSLRKALTALVSCLQCMPPAAASRRLMSVWELFGQVARMGGERDRKQCAHGAPFLACQLLRLQHLRMPPPEQVVGGAMAAGAATAAGPEQQQPQQHLEQEELRQRVSYTLYGAVRAGLPQALEAQIRALLADLRDGNMDVPWACYLEIACAVLDAGLRRPGCWPALLANSPPLPLASLIVTLGKATYLAASVEPVRLNTLTRASTPFGGDPRAVWRLQLLGLLEQMAPLTAETPRLWRGTGEGEGTAAEEDEEDTGVDEADVAARSSGASPSSSAQSATAAKAAGAQEGRAPPPRPQQQHQPGTRFDLNLGLSAVGGGVPVLAASTGDVADGWVAVCQSVEAELGAGPSWEQVAGTAGSCPAAGTPQLLQQERLVVLAASEWLPALLVRRTEGGKLMPTPLSELLPHRAYRVAWTWLLLLARQGLHAKQQYARAGTLSLDLEVQRRTLHASRSWERLIGRVAAQAHVWQALRLAAAATTDVRRGAGVEEAEEVPAEALAAAALEVLPAVLDTFEALLDTNPYSVTAAFIEAFPPAASVSDSGGSSSSRAHSGGRQQQGAGAASAVDTSAARGAALPFDAAVGALLRRHGREELVSGLTLVDRMKGVDGPGVGSRLTVRFPVGWYPLPSPAVVWKAETSDLPICDYAGCVGLQGDSEMGVRLKSCGRCSAADYCSVHCQRLDWAERHKLECGR